MSLLVAQAVFLAPLVRLGQLPTIRLWSQQQRSLAVQDRVRNPQRELNISLLVAHAVLLAPLVSLGQLPTICLHICSKT